MTRPLAAILILAGLAVVGPQVFTALPDQRLVLAGLALAFVGGLLLADNPSNRRTHGRHRG